MVRRVLTALKSAPEYPAFPDATAPVLNYTSGEGITHITGMA